MTTQQPQRILIIGRSPSVLLGAVDLLRDRGYVADATNQFDHVLDHLDEFEVQRLDVVVFGGFVPPGTKEQLRAAMSARNGQVVFVQGLAGIPGLIAAQVVGVTSAGLRDGDHVVYDQDERSVRVTLREPARVAVEAFWAAFVPPEPTSTSRVLVDGQCAAGSYRIAVPEDVPTEASFVAVTVGPAVLTFTVGEIRQSVRNLVPTGAGAAVLPAPPVVNTRA